MAEYHLVKDKVIFNDSIKRKYTFPLSCKFESIPECYKFIDNLELSMNPDYFFVKIIIEIENEFDESKRTLTCRSVEIIETNSNKDLYDVSESILEVLYEHIDNFEECNGKIFFLEVYDYEYETDENGENPYYNVSEYDLYTAKEEEKNHDDLPF